MLVSVSTHKTPHSEMSRYQKVANNSLATYD